MSEGQYFKAKQDLLCKMQDILGKTILSSATNYPITAPALTARMTISLNMII
jgi:hypothetical protein